MVDKQSGAKTAKTSNAANPRLNVKGGAHPVTSNAAPHNVNVTRVEVPQDGIVNVPAGVTPNQIHVDGNDLVITLADGSEILIVNGAHQVPDIQTGGVDLPGQNLIALLNIPGQPVPVAGPPVGSGGNFGTPPGAIDPGFGISPLLPPTELRFGNISIEELQQGIKQGGPPTVTVPESPPTPTQTPGPGITFGPGTEVFEAGLPVHAGLPQGSAFGNNSQITSGTVTYTAPNGLASITFNGQVISTGSTITTSLGTFTVNSLNMTTGVVTYTYTLNTSYPAGATPGDTFAVVVTDQTGQTANGTFTISVIDDHPTANADVANDGVTNYTAITGNVETASGDTNTGGVDVLGANGAHVSGVEASGASALTAVPTGTAGVTIAGHYGELTIHQDGSYSYVRNAGTPGGVSDVFNYQLTDGHGNTSTTTLTINIGQGTPTVTVTPGPEQPTDSAGHALVYEAGLANGSHTGGSATTTGTISYTPGDSPDTITIGNVNATVNATVAGQHGVLTVTAVDTVNHTISYSYTLTSNIIGPTANNGANNEGPADSFAVVVTDTDGSTASASLVVDVIDDVPSVTLADTELANISVSETHLTAATNGVDGTAPDAALTSGSASFANAFHVVQGADGATTAYSLTINGGNGTDSGLVDSQTGQHVVLVLNSSGVVEGHVGSASGALSFTVAVDSTGKVTFTEDRAVVESIASNPDTGEGTHLASGVLSVTATATDGDGDVATASIDLGSHLTMTDDGPVAANDTNVVYSGQTLTVGPSDAANVLHNDLSGADGYKAGAAILGVEAGSHPTDTVTGGVGQVTGAFGVLTLAEDGSYTYVANSNVHGVDTFTYTIQDSDGDSSTATLSITVNAAGPSVGSDTATVSEEALPNGTFTLGVDSDADSSSDVVTHSGTVAVTDNLSNATVTTALTAPTADYFSHGVQLTWTGNGTQDLIGMAGSTKIVEVTIDNSGHYTVTLSGPLDSPNGVNAGENGGNSVLTFGVTAVDNFNNSAIPGALTVNVEDDAPVAVNDANTLTDHGTTVGGNVVTGAGETGGTGADTLGADGFGSIAWTGASEGSVTGAHGTLAVDASGNYTYTLNTADPAVHNLQNGSTLTDTFNYTVTDGDGDTSPATLTITVTENDSAPTIGNASATVSEEALPTGNHDLAGTAPDPVGDNDVTTTSGSFTAAAAFAGDSVTLSLSTNGLPSLTSGGQAIVWSLTDSHTLVGSVGTNAIITVALNDNAGDYTVTLNGPIDQPAPASGSDENLTTFGVTVNGVDNHGLTSSGTITVNVEDDTPVANNDANSITDHGTTVNGNVVTGAVNGTVVPSGTDHMGADGFGSIAWTGQSSGAVTGAHGTLAVDASGGYVYTLNTSDPAVHNLQNGSTLTDVFTYTVKDGDGDASTATLTITITDNDVAPVLTGASSTVSEEALSIAAGNLVNGNNDLGGADSDSGNDVTNTTGHVTVTPMAGDTYTLSLSTAGLPSLTSGGVGIVWSLSGDGQTVTGTKGAAGPTIVTVHLTDGTGDYSVALNGPIDDPTGNGENSVSFNVGVTALDSHGLSGSANISVTVEDDTPVAVNDTNSTTDHATTPATGNVLTNDHPGADGVGSITWTGASGTTVAGTYGTLTIDAAGNYSYQVNTANSAVHNLQSGSTLTETFNYTLTDGDGDTSPATLTITISDNDTAPVLTGASSTVSEEALSIAAGNLVNGNNDLGGADSDSGNDVTNTTGHVTVSAMAGDTYTLALSTAGLPALTSGGVGIVWTLSGDGQTVTGTKGAAGPTILTVHLTDGTGDYSVALNGPIDDPTGNGENSVSMNFAVTATDSHGLTGSANINVTVEDDTPVAVNDTNSTTDHATTPATGNVLTNDHPGADGVGSITWTGAVGTTVTGTYGTLTIGANGAYSYLVNTANSAVHNLQHGSTLTETFNYTLTDGDGDTSPATLTITISDNDTSPVLTGSSVTVSEEALSIAAGNLVNGNNDGGVSDGDTDVTSMTGHVTVTPMAGDTYTLALSTPSASLTSGGVGIVWHLSGDGQTVTGTKGAAGATIITIHLTDGTGDYSVALNGPLDNSSGSPEGSVSFNVGVTATDSHGLTGSANIGVTVEDDAPLPFTPASLTGTGGEIGNTVGDHGTASLNFVAGADGPSATVDGLTLSTTAQADSHNLILNPTASVVNGVTTYSIVEDVGGTGTYSGSDTTVVGTVALNPVTNQYTFTLEHALDTTLSSEGIGTAGTNGAGPIANIILDGTGGNGVAAGPVMDVDAFHYTGTFNPANWTFTGTLVNTDQINSSTQGLGVNSNNFQNPQLINFDFGSDANFTGPMVHSIAMTFPGYKSGDEIDYKLVYENASGTVLGTTINKVTGTDLTGGFTFAAPTGDFIQSLQLYDNIGKGKVQLGAITTVSSTVDQTLTFTTTLQDGDGSQQTSGNFGVEITNAVAPVVLDLTGHGVQFVGESAGNVFNYGSGDVLTAWAAAGEGVLALETASGPVVSFTGYVAGATTDLQGLAAFDTNHDGKIDAGDADFSHFGVIVNGHFETLSQLGIASINLSSDGQAYSAANGQVQVNGSGVFTYANGSTGALADAAFATSQVASAVSDALNGGHGGPDLNKLVDALKGLQGAANDTGGHGSHNAGQSYLDLHTSSSGVVNAAFQHHHELWGHDTVSGTHHR